MLTAKLKRERIGTLSRDSAEMLRHAIGQRSSGKLGAAKMLIDSSVSTVRQACTRKYHMF